MTEGYVFIMTMVNISEAAKLAGISRNHFYRKYINTGSISVSKNEAGKVAIETSELVRVFTTLQSAHMSVAQRDGELTQGCDTSTAVLLEKIKGLEALLKAKDDELEGYRDREKYLYRFLENKPKKRRWFGLF
jgi:predicted site-specific integrase-resolvase